MGDGADEAIERGIIEQEHYEKFKDSPLDVQYDEGIIDENGSIIGNPNSFPGVTNRMPSLWDF